MPLGLALIFLFTIIKIKFIKKKDPVVGGFGLDVELPLRAVILKKLGWPRYARNSSFPQSLGTLGWRNLHLQGAVSATQQLSAPLSPTEAAEPQLFVGSELYHPGDGKGAAQRLFRRKWVSEPPRAVPPPAPRRVAVARLLPWSPRAWSGSCGSCCCRTPSVSAGYGAGASGASGRLRGSPDSDPNPLPRPPSSSRSFFGTPPLCPRSATCWPRRPTLR